MVLSSRSRGFCNTIPLELKIIGYSFFFWDRFLFEIWGGFLSFWHPRSVLWSSVWFMVLRPCSITSNDLVETPLVTIVLDFEVPAGSPSDGGDVTVYVYDISQPSLPTPFLFRSCVYFCLYGPFTCISFHQFSLQLSVFLLCSSGLISAILVLSTICFFMKVSFSPDVIPSGWLGSKPPIN